MVLPKHLVTFIEACGWTYAKTMPEWPHEYIVRDRVDETLFLDLVRHIRANGYESNFYNLTLTYYDHAGMVYWTMGSPIDETTIVNRCLPQNTYRSRKKSGTLPETRDR